MSIINYQPQNHQPRLSKNVSREDSDSDNDLLLQEEQARLKPPSLFQVIMVNDDYTPMEFVVYVLQSFFSMDREKATRIMLQVHTEGRAICGVYTRDIAETKAAQVVTCARNNEHPLTCEIQAVDDSH